MTAITPMSTSATRVRIAVTSPDILARIRQVFASKNMAVEINHLPYVEVTVWPAASAASANPSAIANALHQLVGAVPRANVVASRRLCAEYRLNVVEVGDRSQVDDPLPTQRRHLALVPDPDADDDADDPVRALSQREREVMTLMSRGDRNGQIAAQLRVSEKTVKNHVNRIFKKLGAGSRVEAVLIFQTGRGGSYLSAQPGAGPTARPSTRKVCAAPTSSPA